MEKIYRLLAWLDIDQAVDWLQNKTATQLYPYELLSLCESRRCSAYIKTDGIVGSDQEHEVIGDGIHKVLNPLLLARAGTSAVAELAMEGPVFLTEDEGEPESFWAVWHSKKTSLRNCKALFKPVEIEALARIINGQPEQPDENELEQLRRQLEQERAARESFEAELMSRRANDGNRALEEMRHMLMHEHSEFAAMQQRAEQAERMVTALEGQLAEQAEERRLNNRAFKEMARQLREFHAHKRPAIAPDIPTGLVFPLRHQGIRSYARHCRGVLGRVYPRNAPADAKSNCPHFRAEAKSTATRQWRPGT
jgi:hypothetical protein